MSTTIGSWQPVCVPMAAPSYQWYRGANPISGATSSSYTTVSADGSSQITVQVTRCDNTFDDCNTVTATGTFQHSVAPTAGSVVITGTPQFGQTLTATASGFTRGTPAGNYVYKWYRCTNASDAPGSCTLVRTSSATSSVTDSYTAIASDVNKYLKVVATVTNTCTSGCGSASATSPATSVIQGVPPSVCTAAISGTAQVGQVLTATPSCSDLGTPTATYSYQWEFSTTANGTYSNVASFGTSQTYTVASIYYQDYLKVVVTATNSCSSGCGSARATSPATPQIGGQAPRICVANISASSENSGLLEPGDSFTATPTCVNLGTPAATYSYQWEYSDSADGTYSNIPGATSATYVVDAAYVDDYLEVVVTAANICSSGCGSEVFPSSPIGPVNGVAPTAGSVVISGASQAGQTLTAAASNFDLGAPSAVYSYQWQYSDSADGTYSNVEGDGTSSTYVVDPKYVDDYLEVVITATNNCSSGCGAASATSPPSDPVANAFGTACYARDATTLRCNVSADLNAAASFVYSAYAASATGAVSTASQTVTPGTPFTVNLPSAEPDWDVYVSWRNPNCELDCSQPQSDLGGAGIGDIVIDTTVTDFPTEVVGVAYHGRLDWERDGIGPTGGVGPTGQVGPSGGAVGPTGMYDAGSGTSFKAPAWGLRRLKYHSGGPRRYGTIASITVNGADPKNTTACILFDSVVTEIDQSKRRQLEIGVAGCKGPGVDSTCPNTGSPFKYVETGTPDPNSATKEDYACTFEGNTSIGASNRLGLREKSASSDVWIPIIGNNMLSGPRLGSFDDYVQISEWGEYHGKSDACASSWNASANFKDWQQYVFGTGWVTLHGSQSTKIWTSCPSNAEIWNVGDLVYRSSDDTNHLVIKRSY